MRPALRIAAAVAAVAACLPASVADDKKAADKRRLEREEIIRAMKELDDQVEAKSANGKLKAAADRFRAILVKADAVTVYKLDELSIASRMEPEGEKSKIPADKTFHGYEILDQVTVEKPEVRKAVVGCVADALHSNDFLRALCFNPRHGLVLTVGNEKYELLVCFECHAVIVYQGGKELTSFPLLPTEEANAVTDLFPEKKGGRKEK